MVILDFNPRSRVGSDVFIGHRFIARANFNPRSRVGSDFPYRFYTFPAGRFQSTLPCRERLALVPLCPQ